MCIRDSGICCVRAGVPGKTENLHIRSRVGRYLEHGRIYIFFDGAHTRIYIASVSYTHLDVYKRQRLGVIGDFEHPYLTLKPEFEARQIEILDVYKRQM